MRKSKYPWKGYRLSDLIEVKELCGNLLVSRRKMDSITHFLTKEITACTSVETFYHKLFRVIMLHLSNSLTVDILLMCPLV